MPELPEAEITKRKLTALLNKRIVGFWSDWPRVLRIAKNISVAARDIKGFQVERIRRHGKVIFFDLAKGGGLNNQRILAFHQRMSGSLLLKSQTQSIPSHTHCRVIFSDGEEVLFKDPRKFGVVWYGKPDEVMTDSYLSSLGPDMLSVSAAQFKKRLSVHAGMIKPALLRQDIFSGIGNIIVDEVLWHAKIHPKRTIASLPPADIKKIYDEIKQVIKESIRVQGTSMRDWLHPDGSRGRFQEHMNAYGRNGELCRRCKKGSISRILVGSRGTWICPTCQRLIP